MLMAQRSHLLPSPRDQDLSQHVRLQEAEPLAWSLYPGTGLVPWTWHCGDLD